MKYCNKWCYFLYNMLIIRHSKQYLSACSSVGNINFVSVMALSDAVDSDVDLNVASIA